MTGKGKGKKLIPEDLLLAFYHSEDVHIAEFAKSQKCRVSTVYEQLRELHKAGRLVLGKRPIQATDYDRFNFDVPQPGDGNTGFDISALMAANTKFLRVLAELHPERDPKRTHEYMWMGEDIGWQKTDRPFDGSMVSTMRSLKRT